MLNIFFALPLLASIFYFQPPDEWEYLDAKSPSEYVRIGFIGKAKKQVPPSLNLATEPTELSLKAYVQAVKEVHTTDLHLEWKDLGEVTLRGGKGRLGELCKPTPIGDIKILQGIFIKDKVAYVLTGSSLKEEFPEVRPLILTAIRSMTTFSDLFSAISDPAKKEGLKKHFKELAALESPALQKAEWESLQKTLPKEFLSLGSYWHYLALQEGKKRIFEKEDL